MTGAVNSLNENTKGALDFIYLKHVGIYVKNIIKMVSFYENVFNMKTIVKNYPDEGPMLDDVFNKKNVHIKICKLLTEQGVFSGKGEMLEFIEYSDNTEQPKAKDIYNIGISHLCFGVRNIEKYADLIISNNGKKESDIYVIGNNKCCFFSDCEGNFIELIENL